MPRPMFAGLIVDEYDQPVETTYVGAEPCYVVNDAGFRRHIPSEQVDRQVLELLTSQVEENKEAIADQTAKMLGQDDIFSRAMLLNQLDTLDQQFDKLLEQGIPEEGRVYLGMLGFRIVINLHGEVVRVDQPAAPPSDEGNE